MCGNPVCARCSPGRDTIPTLGNIQVRICKSCEVLKYHEIHTEKFGFISYEEDDWSDLEEEYSHDSQLVENPVHTLSQGYLPKQKREKKVRKVAVARRRAFSADNVDERMKSRVVPAVEPAVEPAVVPEVVSRVVSGVFVPEDEEKKLTKVERLQQKLNAAQKDNGASAEAARGGLLAQAISRDIFSSAPPTRMRAESERLNVTKYIVDDPPSEVLKIMKERSEEFGCQNIFS
eukprot:TRINITY_DN2779_c0_g1_i2.p1 TRINITY_DN2779_c0_g1~~TRINITY_DN2779_c0_g1_i2.p1  ORF type:complete len:233 (-),score=49.16 TRINITY_DN2779_c0_g1_i2:221-919(-)